MAWMIINLLFGTCRRAGIRVLRTPVFTLDKAMPVLRRTFKGREMKKKNPTSFSVYKDCIALQTNGSVQHGI